MKRRHVKITPLVWLRRFRKRRGYGVHSPYAFDYITRVCNENTPYYKYKDLKAEEKSLRPKMDKHWGTAESSKVKRLLFRLVNRAQPLTLVETGSDTAATLYLKAAKEQMDMHHIYQAEDLEEIAELQVDFLYLRWQEEPFIEQVFQYCLERLTPHSVVAVQGIHRDDATKALWERMKDEGVLTFDLYDVGILHFDKTYFKQNYIVNF